MVAFSARAELQTPLVGIRQVAYIRVLRCLMAQGGENAVMAASFPSPPSAGWREDRLALAVLCLVNGVCRWPILTLGLCGLLAVLSVLAAANHLTYQTQRNDLLSADKECQKRWQRYLEAFGDDDDMIIVVEGRDRRLIEQALDDLADRIRQHPEQLDRVFHKADLRHLHDRAMLYLPKQELEGIRDRLDRMDPLFGRYAPLAWQMLSLQTLLSKASLILKEQAGGKNLPASDRDLLSQLPAVVRSAAETLRHPDGYFNPWGIASAMSGPAMEPLRQPQYAFTADGTLGLLVCRPRKEADSFTPARQASATVQAILAEMRPHYPGLKFGLTGLPVLETDEMALSESDSQRAAVWALAAVALLYFLVYRGPRYPLLTVLSLVVGTCWALGWATLTVGHLNILSSAFAVMLIGMGDYGVLWAARYDEERQSGHDVMTAMRFTAGHVGPSIITASLTTAIAFLATLLADFKAVAELGWIAGWGVLACAVSCLLVMPAALTLLERIPSRRIAPGFPRLATPAEDRLGPCTVPIPSSPATAFLPGLARRPRWVLGLGLGVVTLVGLFITRLGYDHNLLNLQPRELESVKWEQKLIERSAGATWDALSIAESREEALALKAKYEALPQVSRVIEVASLIPADQEAKLVHIRAIDKKLSGVPALETIPLPVGSSVEDVARQCSMVGQLAWWDARMTGAMAELRRVLESTPPDVAQARLKEFDRRLLRDLAADLHKLREVCHVKPVTLADVPQELRERYVGAHGEYLVRAFAQGNLWDYESLKAFTAAALAVDPQATGKTFRTLEGLRALKAGFLWAALYAFIAVVIVLWVDLRSVSGVLLALFPLLAGLMLTFGGLGLIGWPLNPANLIALPLILGVGIDHGLHVMHDFRSRPKTLRYRLGRATGRGILVAALTTILGFGTLMLARHRGLASLGEVLALGVAACLIASLLLLPALLTLLDERERARRRRRATPADGPRQLRLHRLGRRVA